MECICIGSCVCGFTHDIIFADDLDTEAEVARLGDYRDRYYAVLEDMRDDLGITRMLMFIEESIKQGKGE